MSMAMKITGGLKWVVIDLKTGKVDGYYAERETAEAVARDHAADNPEHGVLLVEVHKRFNATRIHDERWIFARARASWAK